MASAVLASRNEPSWGQSCGGFMGKQLPYSNNHHLNPNPNPNSVSKKKQFQANGRHNNEDSPGATQTASDDAYSFNQRPIESRSGGDFNLGDYVSYKIDSYTRSELIELRKRFEAELEQIQRLNARIESGKFQPQSVPGKNKKISGNKRPIPFASSKDPKRLCQTTSEIGIARTDEEIGNLMKMCRQVLTKLMKHKQSWIFKEPVDAVAMGLHDYHQIIKNPMDLGTVKTNFGRNLYTSPGDFAADVRLTFNNAMMYNPKGDDVHKIAELLLVRFEELYRPIKEKYEFDQSEELQQGSSWNRIPTPESTKKMKSNSMQTPKKHEKMQPQAHSSNPSSPPNPQLPLAQSPVHTPSPMQAAPVKPSVTAAAAAARTSTGKQPKPKARDPNKRQMSMEEKQKLGIGLQSLPEEKMPQLVQIIRKRNKHMAPEGDEIELDIEAIDVETLWELDRFVTNWKKMVSKTKRQALMVNNSSVAGGSGSGEDNVLSVGEKTDTVKKVKKGEGGEEDVDIGDEMPMSSYPPVEIEKDDGGGGGGHDNNNGHATSSSSSSSGSSSDSSSSSGSDSGSSSGSDSDADDAESRGLESKEFSKP